MVASITQTLSAEATRTAAHRVRSRADALHDAGLVRRFNSGDNGAFSEIVRRHRAKMHQVALGLLKNHADAEEIAQDTFIRGYRGLANFRGDSSLATKAEARTRQLARRVFPNSSASGTQSIEYKQNYGAVSDNPGATGSDRQGRSMPDNTP
jgi:hypothetical protein